MKFKKIASLTLSIAMVAAMASTTISALNTEDKSKVICSEAFTREEYYKHKLNQNDVVYYPNVEANNDFRPKDLKGLMIGKITNYPTVWEANGRGHNYIDISSLGIPVTQENCDIIVKTYWDYLDENPRTFNVTGSIAVLRKFNPKKDCWEFTALKEYFADQEISVIAKKEKAFDDKSAEFVREASKFETDLEKVLYVHNKLIANAKFADNSIKDENGNVIDKQNSYDAYGCIVKGESVCNGYSEAYLHLMQLLGIPAYKVTSFDIRHAWDMVSIDGTWYYLDATWDDPGDYETRTRYDYFLKSAKDFKHGGKDWFIPYNILSGEDFVKTYAGEAFWENTKCIMPYADGNWYCHTNDKTGIQSYDISTGKYTNVVIGEDLEWDAEYGNPNYSNMFISDGRLYYSTETQVKSVKLDGTDKKINYTLTPEELKAGKIYTLVQEGDKAKIEVMARNNAAPAKTTYFNLKASNYNTWDPSKAYGGGSVVSYNGKDYKAKWWTQGNNPSTSDVWMEFSSTTPTPNPDPKPNPKPNPTPNPDPKPDPKPNPVKYEAWDSSKAYGGGSKVSYKGKNYKAKWWTQGNNPSTSDVWVAL